MQQHAVAKVARAIDQRLNILGLTASADREAFWNLVKARDVIDRGQNIVGSTDSVKRFTVLLEGVACFSTQHGDGGRQIFAFHYPGEFLGLHNFLFPRSTEHSEVQALTSCSIGAIDHDELEQAIQRHPAVGKALWRAALTEVSISRQHLVVSRRPALQRVAHLLSEQLARIGIDAGVIPLTQIDVADAVGLSVVHINRIFQELRQLGVLSKQRLIEVVNKEHLQQIAAFDARYLHLSKSLSQWDLSIDG
jgi:CRP-like cAMP-binding protein